MYSWPMRSRWSPRGRKSCHLRWCGAARLFVDGGCGMPRGPASVSTLLCCGGRSGGAGVSSARRARPRTARQRQASSLPASAPTRKFVLCLEKTALRKNICAL